MKTALLPLALAAALAVPAASCRCGPDVPTAVTVRVKNALDQPIWVDQTLGLLGVELQRGGAGGWTTFTEELACGCQTCTQVCACTCDPGQGGPLVIKIAGGSNVEREWAGVIQEGGAVSCGALFGGTACFRPSIPSLDERLRARLCYALGPPLGSSDPGDAGVPVPGAFDPGALQCVTSELRPSDGVVELSPLLGAPCQDHAECHQDAGELCFSGGCTPGCPATGFPEYGAAWQVAASVTDQGFFTTVISGGVTTHGGTGTLTDVQINNGTMRLSLSRPAAGGGALAGTVYLTVPAAYFPVLSRNETLTVKVVDASTRQIQNNRAITLRDGTGRLLLAADPGVPAAILAPADTAPFSVAETGEIVGCDLQPCGKRLHFRSAFGGAALDGGVLELDPGSSSVQVASGLTYKLLNLAHHRPGQFCTAQPQMAYLAAAQR